MKRMLILLLLVSFSVVIVSCGVSQKDFDKAQAQVKGLKDAWGLYHDYLDAQAGERAEASLFMMQQKLDGIGITLADLTLNKDVLDKHVQDLYASDAAVVYKKLVGTHGKIVEAEDLAKQYGVLIRKAGKDVSPAMEKAIALQVARNKREEGTAQAAAHGVIAKPAPKPVTITKKR